MIKISSLLHIYKLPPLAGSVFWAIQAPTSQMNMTAKHENVPTEWLLNSIRLTWNVEIFP